MTQFFLQQLKRWAILLLLLLTQSLQAQSEQKDFPVEKLRQAVTFYFLQTDKFQADQLQVEFPNLPEGLKELDGNRFEVLPSSRQIRKGSQYVRIGVFDGDSLVEEFTTRVVAKTFDRVVISKGSILRHAELHRADLMLQKRETTHLVEETYDSLSALNGVRARRFIPDGEILTSDFVEKIPVVTRGQRVKIHFIKNTLEIVLPGLVREDGGIGDEVTVKSLSTNKRYSATVIDAENVFLKLW